MRIFIGGNANTGKTTSFLGSKKLGVKGLPPENTILITASAKELPMTMWGRYVNADFKDLPSEAGDKEGPIIINNFVMSVSDKPNLILLFKYLKRAMTHGIKRGETIHKLENIIIDDLQDFINDHYYASDEKDNFKAMKSAGVETLSLMNGLKSLHNELHKNAKTLKNRVDIFYFAHMVPNDITQKYSRTNPVGFKLIGNILKQTYPLDGQFNNMLYAKDFKLLYKKESGLDFLRLEEELLPDDAPAQLPNDLGVIKEYINNYYNKFVKN